ncbi:MAG: SDR family NAD(P)-dependent oxidoreductase [Streptosporangiales bacterium]|nr:SDR family NAD(P)-dependent oxidoreductase [Streptosporangiales bacterium]
MSEPRIALITGANQGIGFETARALGAAGHTVHLGARDPERGTKAEVTLRAEGLDVRYVRLDVTDPATVAAAARTVEDRSGRLDILVNNAAITGGTMDPPSTLPLDLIRSVYETNVFGVIAVINAMLPLLRRSDAGRIANVGSGLGTMDFLTHPERIGRRYAALLPYNSTKAALHAITLIYAAELADTPIRVNAVSPGFCATDLNDHAGTDTAAQGGERIADQVTRSGAWPNGVFLSEQGGTYPW